KRSQVVGKSLEPLERNATAKKKRLQRQFDRVPSAVVRRPRIGSRLRHLRPRWPLARTALLSSTIRAVFAFHRSESVVRANLGRAALLHSARRWKKSAQYFDN